MPSGNFMNVLNPVNINKYFEKSEQIKQFDTLSILSIIYISGAVFFCLKFLSSVVKIHFLYFRFPRYKFKGFKAVVLDNEQSPFTFFNILFISRIDFESDKIDEMIVHEIAHKEEFHTFDVLLLEIMTIIQWFNPFIWMFRRALKSEHEFIADNKVLLEGFDKVKYQKLLFERSLGITSFNLTNNFNYSLLKKRLKMMTISKSSSLIKIKYLISMPFLLLTFTLMAVNFNSFGQMDNLFTKVDVEANYKNGGINGIKEFVKLNLTYPKSTNISAKIFVQFVVDEEGKVANAEVIRCSILDNPGENVTIKEYNSKSNPEVSSKVVADLQDEAIRVIKLLNGFTPAQKDGKIVKEQFVIPINFIMGQKKG